MGIPYHFVWGGLHDTIALDDSHHQALQVLFFQE